MLMVVGLAGFAFAQDLDAPVSGAAIEKNADENASSSLFDQLMAQMQSAAANVIEEGRSFSWRKEYWWVNAWEWEHHSDWTRRFTESMVWAGDNRDTFEEWKTQLSAAEQLALSNEAHDAHERIVSSGLN